MIERMLGRCPDDLAIHRQRQHRGRSLEELFDGLPFDWPVRVILVTRGDKIVRRDPLDLTPTLTPLPLRQQFCAGTEAGFVAALIRPGAGSLVQ